MEFEKFKQFMSNLEYAKRKYPMIRTYLTYLNKLESTAEQQKELNCFKNFLILNQTVQDKTFVNYHFKTGKKSISLDMRIFINDWPNDTIEDFWKTLNELDSALFFNDPKPTSLEEHLENNDLVNFLKEKILEYNIDITNIQTMLTNPEKILSLYSGLQKDIEEKFTKDEIIQKSTSLIKHLSQNTNSEFAKPMSEFLNIIENKDTESAEDLMDKIRTIMLQFQNNL